MHDQLEISWNKLRITAAYMFFCSTCHCYFDVLRRFFFFNNSCLEPILLESHFIHLQSELNQIFDAVLKLLS